MNKRRMLIVVLFFVIAVFATSRTLVLRKAIQEEQVCSQTEESDSALSRPWGRLLHGLILVSVSLPFFITAFVLLLYTIQDEG